MSTILFRDSLNIDFERDVFHSVEVVSLHPRADRAEWITDVPTVSREGKYEEKFLPAVAACRRSGVCVRISCR